MRARECKYVISLQTQIENRKQEIDVLIENYFYTKYGHCANWDNNVYYAQDMIVNNLYQTLFNWLEKPYLSGNKHKVYYIKHK